MEALTKFLKDEDGVTAIEYGLIAAVIALGILASVRLVRTWLVNQFTRISQIVP
jgi:pilus assembly protein Flp/PilA